MKSILTVGRYDEFGCPMGKTPPLAHLIMMGAVLLVLTALLGALIPRKRRD